MRLLPTYLCSQCLHVRGDSRETLPVGILDDGRQKALGGLYCNADVDVVVLPSEVLLPRTVDARDLLQGKGCRLEGDMGRVSVVESGGGVMSDEACPTHLDDKVVDGDLPGRVGRINLLSQLEHGINLCHVI